MMRIATLVPTVLIAALVAWPPAMAAETSPPAPPSKSEAEIPSFDCAQASSARENTICRDPALSALGAQLGRLYRERLALVSPAGAQLLQESERSWLHFIGIVCPSDGPKNKPWLQRGFCLTRQYNDRIRELGEVAQVGPFIFNRVDIYAAQPSGDESGGATGFYVQHAAYPQIDTANSPELRTWNQENVRRVPTDGDCGSGPGDYDIDYKVGYANARFISVEWTDSTYCQGTAHGFGGVRSNNIVLLPHLRPLTAQDLFGSGEAWTSALKERFWIDLIRTGWRPPNNQPDIKQRLEDDIVQPDRWLFTKDGLQIAFSSYEGGCYACTPQPVTLPWSELKPLLSKAAIAP